jgi:hypothetical protein
MQTLPLAEEDVLEAAAVAEEFQLVFPRTAEALLVSCVRVLAGRLTAPADFVQYAARLAARADPLQAALAMRLVARIQEPQDGREPMENTVKESKDPCVRQKDQEDVETEEVEKKTMIKCHNCKLATKRYKHESCRGLNGKNVLHITPGSGQVGCQVVSVGTYWKAAKRGRVATVLESLEQGKVLVQWKGEGGSRIGVSTIKEYKLQSNLAHAQGEYIFAFHCQ